MPSHRSPLLAASLLLLLSLGPLATWARPNPSADLKEDIPVEELFNELVEEAEILHDKEVNYLQALGAVAARQQREEQLLLQQERHQERQRAHLAQLAAAAAVNGGDQEQQQQQQASLLDELPALGESSAASRSAREQQQQQLLAPKAMTYTKAKDEKKNNHYMALCHFKLCNMGRKRNTRFLHFWN